MDKKTNSRTWGIIIPDEWPDKDQILETCKKISQRYYIILHNQDWTDDGEEKKLHWHVLMKFTSARQLGTVANYFNDYPSLKKNSYEKIANIDGAKRYLVHYDSKEKYQYDPNQVITNDLAYKDCLIEKQSSIDEVDELINLMDTNARTATEYVKQFRGTLQHMNSYQKLMAIRALRSDWQRQNNC